MKAHILINLKNVMKYESCSNSRRIFIINILIIAMISCNIVYIPLYIVSNY